MAFTAERGDFLVEARSLSDLLAEYEAQCARSNEIVAGASLDDLGQDKVFPAGAATLRSMLQQMLEGAPDTLSSWTCAFVCGRYRT